MQQRRLGPQGLTVSAIGLGCMGMSWAYGARDDDESVATIHRALELGVTFFDTAEVYGPFTNEQLLGTALRGRRDRAVIATKCGFEITPAGQMVGVNGRPEKVKAVADASLARLGVDHIDLYYQHRVDPNVPIEDTVGAMADLVRAGKVRFIGLSEASAATIRRAHAVHPVSALQSEYSLFERGVERDVLPTCRALGIGFVPYSPLGRGFLTGQVQRAEDYGTDDNRRNFPRFQGENFDRNMALVAAVKELAARLDCTPGQVALAWLLHRGDDVVPIPGTKRRRYLEENVGAAGVTLGARDVVWLDERLPVDAAAGDRYSAPLMQLLDR